MHTRTLISLVGVAAVLAMGACNGDDPEPDSGPDASLDLRLDKPRKEGPAPEQKVDQAE